MVSVSKEVGGSSIPSEMEGSVLTILFQHSENDSGFAGRDDVRTSSGFLL